MLSLREALFSKKAGDFRTRRLPLQCVLGGSGEQLNVVNPWSIGFADGVRPMVRIHPMSESTVRGGLFICWNGKSV